MIKYISRRLFYGGVVLVLVVTLISSIIYLAPVDPASLTFGQRADVESVEAKRSALGLNQPLSIQLLWYLRDISPISIHEDSPENQALYHYKTLVDLGEKVLVLKSPYLRESYQSGRSVREILGQAIPQTAFLALSALSIAIFIGISLGIVAAIRQNSWFDNAAVVSSVFGYSIPSYVTAIILAFVFGFALSEYTGLNITGSLLEINDLGEEYYAWQNLILPAIALGIRPVGIITQLTRSAMLDVLSQDYIRTAKSKGLSKRTVIIKHALRNALNPVTTAISGWFGALLAGSFFVESVFSYKGLGYETVQALLTFDIPVILGCVLFTAVVFVAINVFTDLIYALLDPRVSVS
ncbi:MAG: peptide/nickel transport system permease protein [Cognaticolwellia sp.]|jgi:peptide/nickel transport system permease protein